MKPNRLRLAFWALTSLAVCGAFSPSFATVALTTSRSTWLTDVGGSGVTASTSTIGTDGTTVSSVALAGGGSLTSSVPLTILTAGSTWNPWSGGYTGQVLYSGTGVTSVTLTPSGVGALGFEVEPLPLASYNVTETLSTGQTISALVNGNGGAQFFGYYGLGVTSVTVSSSVDFAVGNFISPSMATIINSSTVKPHAGGSISQTSEPVALLATFTPPTTLLTAATDLGYTGFDWEQQVTNWPALNSRLFTPSGVALSAPPAFLDPIPGGYSYTNPSLNCGNGHVSTAVNTANPYFYNPSTIFPATDCFALAAHETVNTLSFGDQPHESTLPTGNTLDFLTCLVGINPSGSPSPCLYQWTWNSDYTGSVGGVTMTVSVPTTERFVPGQGGVDILAQGVPVPESSSLFGLLAGLVALFSTRRLTA